MLAEKYGYINSVDKYVFENAIAELISAPDLSISINISNLGVQDKVLVNHYKNLLSDSGVGNRLIIEITETAMNDSFEQTKYFVDTMKSLGCKIALDDFGAGYTSFSQVRKFAIDIIKIDGSFITDINTNEKNRIFVETIIKTAEELGCKTVAEFVENGSIAKQLIGLNVDYMQGNFFSPASNYRSWEKVIK
jgi:EAL domain-containing protein (putative c-di-GMP-specific phosphodiesterase class I)